jgi:hypothetical protein
MGNNNPVISFGEMSGASILSVDDTAADWTQAVLPAHTSPWSGGENLDASNTISRLFKIEWGNNIVPWRFRIALGLHSYGLHSARKLKWADIGFDKLNRKGVWRKFGQPLHFLTLEFSDVSLEKGYQLDYARRSHRYVEVSGLFVALICAIAVGKSVQDNPMVSDCSVMDAILSQTLFYVAIMGLLRSAVAFLLILSKRLSKWIIENFQLVQSSWSLGALTMSLTVYYNSPFPECVIGGSEAGMLSLLVILVAVFFRLRFIYLLAIFFYASILILSLRWVSPVAGFGGPVDVVMILFTILASLATVYFHRSSSAEGFCSVPRSDHRVPALGPAPSECPTEADY